MFSVILAIASLIGSHEVAKFIIWQSLVNNWKCTVDVQLFGESRSAEYPNIVKLQELIAWVNNCIALVVSVEDAVVCIRCKGTEIDAALGANTSTSVCCTSKIHRCITNLSVKNLKFSILEDRIASLLTSSELIGSVDVSINIVPEADVLVDVEILLDLKVCRACAVSSSCIRKRKER